jgi:hypothetical protein
LKGFSHHHEDKGNNREELSLHFSDININY